VPASSDTEEELRALALGYAAAVDALDGPAFADLFTPDGELWVPDLAAGGAPTIRRTGRDQLERIPSGLARYHATHHVVGPTTLAVAGGAATGEVTGVAHHLQAGPDPGGPGVDLIWYLRFADKYRATGPGWRVARRILHLRWIEERPVTHLGPGR